MKVTIENKGSASLSIKGRHGFHIDAHSTVVVELPDTSASANVLQRLRREYPAMRVIVERGGAQPPSAPGMGENGAAPSGTNTPQPPSAPSDAPAEGADGNTNMMNAEDFASRATVTEGEAGWWTVAVDGIRDIKVRSAKNEANAIEMAYAKYLEGQGTGE